MPKGLICGTCGEWCSRARTLRRHIEREHSNNATVNAVLSDDDVISVHDDWLQEEVCSIDLPPTNSSPNHSPLLPVDCVNNQSTCSQNSAAAKPEPEIPEETDNTPLQPEPEHKKLLVNASIQTTTTTPNVDRIRRQLWAERQHTTRLILVHWNPGSRPACGRDATYAQDVDVREQRRICDCSICVEHAINATGYLIEAPLPLKPGIRYVHLPGLTSSTATPHQLRLLDNKLREGPERTYAACGCSRCIAHRNLLRSWTEALRFQATSGAKRSPLEAGGCHGLCRDFNRIR